MQTLIRHRVLRRLIWICTVCQCASPGFTDSPLYTSLWRHSEKNNAAINNRYLDFVQTRGFISLVNDNIEHCILKQILKYVYFGRIVNSRPMNPEGIVWIHLMTGKCVFCICSNALFRLTRPSRRVRTVAEKHCTSTLFIRKQLPQHCFVRASVFRLHIIL